MNETRENVLFKMRPTTGIREDIKIIFARFSVVRLHNSGVSNDTSLLCTFVSFSG